MEMITTAKRVGKQVRCSTKYLRDSFFVDWRFSRFAGTCFWGSDWLKFPLGTTFCGFLFSSTFITFFGKKPLNHRERVEKMWHPGGLRKWCPFGWPVRASLTWPFDWLLWLRFLCLSDLLFVASSDSFFSMQISK